MTAELSERRKGKLLTLFAAAFILLAVAAVTLAIESRSTKTSAAGGPVLPGIAQSFASAHRISVVSAEASYRIENTTRGWVMRDRGDYPVQAGRLAQLSEGLEQLRNVRRMTNDPAKHERLGVTDPREGGRGVLLRIEKADTALLVDLILGVEPGGRTYLRRPGQDQVWQVESEELPPLRDVSSWLDLRPLAAEALQFTRVEIMPAEGRAYVLARDAAGQPWRIADPALAASSQAVVTQAAEKLLQTAPSDVLEAPAVQGQPRARVRASTVEGVVVDGELIPSGGKLWLKLVARAGAPEQEPVALAINERVSGWAYALSDIEASALAPPLSALLPLPE
jgi:Domain of unknown function (DUF4340)